MLQPLILLFTFSLSSSENLSETRLKDTDSSWNYLGVTGYAGYITMNALTGSSLFYWLFESIDSNITTDSRPLIIWLEGGPGCSGTFTMIWQGVSPIIVRTNTQPMRTNLNDTWTTSYHVMSIDFPFGVGFSFANSQSDEKSTTLESTNYLYNFLVKLGKKYPSWFNRDIYVFGYSYAGHWATGLGWTILQKNAMNTGFNINLKGVGIGGPWVDPSTQSQTYASYAMANSLINENQGKIMKYYQDLLKVQVQAGQMTQATSQFTSIRSIFKSFTDGVDEYNVRGFDDYNEDNFDRWITSTATRQLLNVGSTPWIDCNHTIYEYYSADISNSTAPLLSSILDRGIKVLLYAGQDDFLVNSPGVFNMISLLDWSGIYNFLQAQKIVWNVDGQVAGYVQSNQNLTYVVVLKSGHIAQYNQPVVVKNMVERFINGTGWN
jgi:carboxypeptidase C (cathepsin A)